MSQRRSWKRRWVRPTLVTALAAATAVATAGTPAAAYTTSVSYYYYGGGTSGWYVQPTVTSAPDLAKQINASPTQLSGLDGRGVGVALIDTGVVPVPGLPAAQIVNGPDLSLESQAPNLRYLDSYGHGTHMAGIIVGSDAAAGYRGLAPKVKLTSVKVATGTGTADVSQIIAAIDWVVEHRNDDPANPIRVINLSYGTDGSQDYRTDPLSFAVENAWRAGIVVVVAAGNTGAAATRLTTPARDPHVLAVGSFTTKSTTSTADDVPSTFSAGSTGRRADIYAPGESILSLRNTGSTIDTAYPSAQVGTALFKGSGTSQAAAVVSGAVALLLQKRPMLTPDYVKRMLKVTASPMPAAGRVTSGTGKLNLGAALGLTSFTYSPSWDARGTGTGSLEGSRGTIHVADSGVDLTGERDIFGALNTKAWATAAGAGTAWSGGVWMGRRMAADGWTGSSWASRTWGSAAWSGQSWASIEWTSTDWSGRYWSGRYWSTGNWSGRYWSDSSWTGTSNVVAR